MELSRALEGQYRAGLAMLRQCIERCPDAAWAAGDHPRSFWRIAYHAIYYTHLYLMPEEKDFEPWEKDQPHARILWDDDEAGVPPVETTYSQSEMLDYLTLVESNLKPWIEKIDFEAPTSGFSWYKIPKLDHQLVNLRHLGIHIGQLQELLFARGIDLDWVGRR